MKLTKAHVANILLSLLAFGLFCINQFYFISGSILDMSGPLGALILTVFLGLGIVVQVAKMIEGHHSWEELGMTWILLVSHVLFEMYIWYGTQLAAKPLPHNLANYIVGLYWVTGVIDILVLTWNRNQQTIRGEVKTRTDLEKEIELLRLTNRFVEERQTTKNNDTRRKETFDPALERYVSQFQNQLSRGEIFQRQDIEDRLGLERHMAIKMINYGSDMGLVASGEKRGYYIYMGHPEDVELSTNGNH